MARATATATEAPDPATLAADPLALAQAFDALLARFERVCVERDALKQECAAEREMRSAALRETQDLRDQVRWRTAERDRLRPYQAAFLAGLDPFQRAALRTLADLGTATADGWVSEEAIIHAVRYSVYSAYLDLAVAPVPLIEHQEPDNAFSPARLTDLGRDVAAALGEG